MLLCIACCCPPALSTNHHPPSLSLSLCLSLSLSLSLPAPLTTRRFQANASIASELNVVKEYLLTKALGSLEREKLSVAGLDAWGIYTCPSWLDFGWRRTIIGEFKFEADAADSEGRSFVVSFSKDGTFSKASGTARCWPVYDCAETREKEYPKWDSFDEGEAVEAMVEVDWEDKLTRPDQVEPMVSRGGRGYWTLAFLKSVLHFAGCTLSSVFEENVGMFGSLYQATEGALKHRVMLQKRTRARFIVRAFGQLVCDKIRPYIRRPHSPPSVSTARFLVTFLQHIFALFQTHVVACYTFDDDDDGHECGEPLFDFIEVPAGWAELFSCDDDGYCFNGNGDEHVPEPAKRMEINASTKLKRLSAFVDGSDVYKSAKRLGVGAQRMMGAQLKQRFEDVYGECVANLNAMHAACANLTQLLCAWSMDTSDLMEEYTQGQSFLMSDVAAVHPERSESERQMMPHWSEVLEARAASGKLDLMWPPAPETAPRICVRSSTVDCFCGSCMPKMLKRYGWIAVHRSIDAPMEEKEAADMYLQQNVYEEDEEAAKEGHDLLF